MWDQGKEKLTIVKAYQRNRKHIRVPRQYGISYAENNGIPITEKVSDGHKITGMKKLTLREGQDKFVDGLEDYFISGVPDDCRVEAHTGFGKSHPAGTKVIMYDGSIRCVEDVVVGDHLMGPDSKLRKVIGTHKGHGAIYKVTPNKGEPWECNGPHVLSLKCTRYKQWDGNRKTYQWKGGNIVNIPVEDYLGRSARFKHLHKLYRAELHFTPKDISNDPYFTGVYLGDGSVHNPCITVGVKDRKMHQWILHWAKVNKVKIRAEGGNGCTMLHMSLIEPKRGPTNWLRRFTEHLYVNGEKRIPEEYLLNDRENRLQLLAGLLDSDGHLVKKTVYEFVTKYKGLSDDVLFLSRSLGLAAYCNKVTKGIKSLGFTGEYYRIHISGDTDCVPCKIEYKQADKRKQKKC